MTADADPEAFDRGMAAVDRIDEAHRALFHALDALTPPDRPLTHREEDLYQTIDECRREAFAAYDDAVTFSREAGGVDDPDDPDETAGGR